MLSLIQGILIPANFKHCCLCSISYRIFEMALNSAGIAARDSIHVGDDYVCYVVNDILHLINLLYNRSWTF